MVYKNTKRTLYLIVNNDFHVENLLNQVHQFKSFEVCVLRIPYNLKVSCSVLSDNIITIESPYKKLSKFFNPLMFYRAKKKIDNIGFCKKDTVIFLTEYDPVNLYAVYRAKLNGSKTILLEEGIATYYNNISNSSEKYSSLELLKFFYLKFFIMFNFVDYVKHGHFNFKLKDRYIDYIYKYQNIALVRDVKQITIESCSENIKNLDINSCIFLNQPIYQSYMNKDEYIKVLIDCIDGVGKNFNKIYFKFHPRDEDDIKAKIVEVFERNNNVVMVSESLDLKMAIELHTPYFAVSFFSDALFKLSMCGLKMVFIYHLIPQLDRHLIIKNISAVLNLMSYEFSNSILELKENNKNVIDVNPKVYLSELL